MTTWTRQAAGHYTAGNSEIRRDQIRFGDACGSTVTRWHITIDGIRMDSWANLAGAKIRAALLPAIMAGEKCWARGCDQPATGSTPRATVNLPGDGEIATCDRCHLSFTGIPRNLTGRRCWSSDCSRPAKGLTARAAIYGRGSGFVATCNGCHRHYTGQER
jgi:hypothetical protein